MTLINCPACGKSVSREALGCPGCGHPIKLTPPPVPARSSGLGWGLGCLLAIPALMVVVAIVGLLAAIAIPSFMKARQTSQLYACANNLRMIEQAKELAAQEHGHREGDPVPELEISEYLPNGFSRLLCPSGGAYDINPLGQAAECSTHGDLEHMALPEPRTPAPARRSRSPQG